MYRECAVAHEKQFLTIRQIAEALDRCDFDQQCETDVCWQIHGDVAGDAAQPPSILPRNVGQEYGEPIPSPPSSERNDCDQQCGREHCEEWLKCGNAYQPGSVMLQRCRDRVSKKHERCHSRCRPGVG